MALQIILTVFYLLLFNYLIFRFRVFQIQQLKPLVTALLFNLKFMTGIFIWMVYTFYYKDIQNNDVHKFFNDALVLNQSAHQHPQAFAGLITGNSCDSASASITSAMKNWNRNFDEAPFNENRTIIRLNALLIFFSFRVYFVHILTMCFFSLFGWVLLINAVFQNSKSSQIVLAMAAMLLPSVLFWTSGVMKEPLLILGLGIFTFGLFRHFSLKSALCMVAGFVVILISKFFILAALIPASIAFSISKSSDKNSGVIVKYAGVMSLSLVLAFGIQRVIPRINPQQILVNKQQHSVKEAEYFNAGSRIAIPQIQPNAISVIQNAPLGIWNTIMRPYLWEGKNIMMIASALENLLVLLIIICCLSLTDYRNFSRLNTVLMLLSFSLAYFALIGICTPVLGNLVRYRAPVLPFLLFAFMLNVKNQGILKKLATIFQFDHSG